MISQLNEQVPFEEAFSWARKRGILPTELGHDELRGLRLAMNRRALILARVSDARILSEVHDRVGQIARGIQDAPGNGMDYATFRVEMQQVLDATDYKPQAGREGTISDLRSQARLNLIVETENVLWAGAARQASDLDPDVLDAFPAWELYRAKQTKVQRNWKERWAIAARASGDGAAMAALQDHGRMIARKDSGIWKALGSASLFPDALDVSHPPFAFQSGMDVENVNRMTAINVGVFQRGDVVRAKPEIPSEPDYSTEDIMPSAGAHIPIE